MEQKSGRGVLARAFAADPPAGSMTLAAIQFGIDPTQTLRNMFEKTPADRFADAERSIGNAQRFSNVRMVKRAAR